MNNEKGIKNKNNIVEKMPVVTINDEGIRPAGKKDECFYCNSKIGEKHKYDCVTFEKRVKLKVIFEIEVKVPHSWDKELIEYHKNESRWCKDNILDDIENYIENNDNINCACDCCTILCIKDNVLEVDKNE